jgi:hypothetical protein
VETPPNAQRAVSDKTPIKLMPGQVAAILAVTISMTFAAAVWATNIVVRQSAFSDKQDSFQKGQDELREWARGFDRRMDMVESALGVRSPVTDKPRPDRLTP